MAKTTQRKITDYIPNAKNHNLGSERGSGMLEHSFRQYGAGRSLLVDKNGVIIAGNQSQQGALNAGIEDVIEVETDGKTLVVVKRKDLDLEKDKAAVELGYMDNRANEVSYTLDIDQLVADIQGGADLTSMYTAVELEKLLEVSDDFDLGEPDEIGRGDVPDALFASDNEWGVPTLDIDLQATALEMPFTRWGKTSRKGRMNGTYHFYTDDYKFDGLWSDPSPVINSKCVNAVEPNVSTNPNLPRALVLHGIYRKRWIARFWQQYGIRIFVDLNIEVDFADLALLGVPAGWKAYANRGYGGQSDHLDTAYSWACERAQTDKLLYVVYGGGKGIAEYCRSKGWLYIKEDAHETEGREY